MGKITRSVKTTVVKCDLVKFVDGQVVSKALEPIKVTGEITDKQAKKLFTEIEEGFTPVFSKTVVESQYEMSLETFVANATIIKK